MFVVVELCDEAFERAPERQRVGAGVRVGEVGNEARVARGDAGDLAGAEIDQQVQLGVRVAHGGGETEETFGVGADVGEGVIMGEHSEADLDHVVQVHLQHCDRPEAPEDTQDDLPERVHGWEYTRASGAVSSGEGYPTVWRAKVMGDWEN